MKKIIVLIVAFLLAFSFNSCRQDGDWEDNGATGQFGFKIERDKDFIEKAVGEVNQLKFNIVPKYDFNSIKTSFKFTTSLNGVLKLNGQTLNANQEYDFTSKDNVFEYTGNVAGQHRLTITVKNEKGEVLDEEFNLPYGVSEFTHTYTGGTAEIFQGDNTQYLMKIVPGQGQPTTGYQIMFNSYTGTIKLNGVAVTSRQYYSLPNIDNFNVTLNTNTAGQNALHYTIKNATVSKDYSIQQQVTARQITVESMNISAESTSPNSPLSLIGVIKKTPVTGNTTVQYKTWISSASNNNTSGIQNTNNAYISYALGANGSFTYNFNAIEPGTYTYNIQFKDEYGNESAIKSFNVTVENTLSITTPPTVTVNLQRTASAISGGSYDIRHRYLGSVLNVAAATSKGNGIAKVVFELNFGYNGQTITKTYTYNYNNLPEDINLNFLNTNDSYQLAASIGAFSSNPVNATDGTFTVYIYDKYNKLVTATGTAKVSVL